MIIHERNITDHAHKPSTFPTPSATVLTSLNLQRGRLAIVSPRLEISNRTVIQFYKLHAFCLKSPSSPSDLSTITGTCDSMVEDMRYYSRCRIWGTTINVILKIQGGSRILFSSSKHEKWYSKGNVSDFSN